MLTEKDIQLLAGVFATKDDLAKLASAESVSYIRTNLNDLTQGVRNLEKDIGSLTENLNAFKKTTEGRFNTIAKNLEDATTILREFIDHVDANAEKKSTTIDERLDKIDAWNKLVAAKLGLSMQ